MTEEKAKEQAETGKSEFGPRKRLMGAQRRTAFIPLRQILSADQRAQSRRRKNSPIRLFLDKIPTVLHLLVDELEHVAATIGGYVPKEPGVTELELYKSTNTSRWMHK